MASFCTRLRELRKQNGLSQQDLADKMSVTKQTISQYERGVRVPDYDNLLTLCDIFNVSSDYMLGKSDVTLRFLTSSEIERLSSISKRLNTDEQSLLEKIRRLNPDGLARLNEELDMMLMMEKFTLSEHEKAGRLLG